MRCPKCGGYSFDSDDRCLNCGYTPPAPKPPAWWGSKQWQIPPKPLESKEQAAKTPPSAPEEKIRGKQFAEAEIPKGEHPRTPGEGQRMNRGIAILLISILVVGIAGLGVLLWQKIGDVNLMELRLKESQGAVTALQAQLAQAQQNVANLQTKLDQSQRNEAALRARLTESEQNVWGLAAQLSEAKKTIAALRAELDELKSPPLTASAPVGVDGDLPGDRVVSIPIELNRFEKVQGEIIATGISPIVAYIQDPAGGVVQDFGQIWQSNFMFTAQTGGRYTVVIRNPVGVLRHYRLVYTIYRR